MEHNLSKAAISISNINSQEIEQYIENIQW